MCRGTKKPNEPATNVAAAEIIALQVPLHKVLNANPGINYYKQNELILGACLSHALLPTAKKCNTGCGLDVRYGETCLQSQCDI